MLPMSHRFSRVSFSVGRYFPLCDELLKGLPLHIPASSAAFALQPTRKHESMSGVPGYAESDGCGDEVDFFL